MGTPCEWQAPGSCARAIGGPLAIRRPSQPASALRAKPAKSSRALQVAGPTLRRSGRLAGSPVFARPCARLGRLARRAGCCSAASSASSFATLAASSSCPARALAAMVRTASKSSRCHEVEIGGHPLDALAHPGLDLLPQAAQGVEGPARDTGQIVEQAVAGLHGKLLASGGSKQCEHMGRLRTRATGGAGLPERSRPAPMTRSSAPPRFRGESRLPFFAIPFPTIDPVLISIGPFAIRWYALAYIVGIVLGWRLVRRLVQRPGWRVTPEAVDDLRVLRHPGRHPGRPDRLRPVLPDRTTISTTHWTSWPSGTAACPSMAACSGVLAATLLFARQPQARILRADRRAGGGDADRPVLRPHRQLHQWRAVGPGHGRALGRGLPQCRAGAAPSEPALRGRPRGRWSCSR